MKSVSSRLYIPIYTITLILSAFLLFSVQPMFGKMVLPLLGGSASVWNTTMLFFQAMLLGGYTYAHLSSKFLSLKIQGILHVVLLALFTVFLPLAIPDSWPEPDSNGNLIIWQLGLMLCTVGGPFFALAGSAPLFQRWFSYTDHKDADNPYFLYAASNIGSMSALLAYPFIIEPLFAVQNQTMLWMFGYLALGVMTLLSASTIWRKNKQDTNIPHIQKTPAASLKLRMYMTWLALAFIPSSLMLGVTTYITTDIASAPLLWIVPLALYLGTFIIAFAKHKVIKDVHLYKLHRYIILLLAIMLLAFSNLPALYLVIVHLLVFSISAQVCHSKLADLKPPPSHLTIYFLILSIGGVLGGFFNAIVAPLLFTFPIEYTLVLALSLFVPFYGDTGQSIKEFLRRKDAKILLIISAVVLLCLSLYFGIAYYEHYTEKKIHNLFQHPLLYVIILGGYSLSSSRLAFGIVFSIMIIAFPAQKWIKINYIQHAERNYFGVSTVSLEQDGQFMKYTHGSTLHGVQWQNKAHKLTPLSYYHTTVKNIFNLLPKDTLVPQKIAAIGLGVGTIACYAQENRHFDFYEIDPAVKQIAEDPELFTYLSDCGSPYGIILGDGRQQIAKAPDHFYDMIFLDAFSSDSIPIHLLTHEAFDIYLQKLKPDGILVTHLSNRYLNLVPLVNKASQDIEMESVFKFSRADTIHDTEYKSQATLYGILSNNKDVIDRLINELDWSYVPETTRKSWTDDYANILDVFMIRKPDMDLFKKQENEATEAENKAQLKPSSEPSSNKN